MIWLVCIEMLLWGLHRTRFARSSFRRTSVFENPNIALTLNRYPIYSTDNSIQETCTLNAQGYHGGVASGSRPYDVEFEYQVIVPQLVSNSAISSVLDTLIPESILPHFFECGGRRLRASSRKLQIRTGPFFIVARGDPEVAITGTSNERFFGFDQQSSPSY